MAIDSLNISQFYVPNEDTYLFAFKIYTRLKTISKNL